MPVESWIAATEPIDDGLAQGWNAPDRRVAAELAEMLLQDRPEKRRDHRLGLAEREIDRASARLDPVEQTREAREGRADQPLRDGSCAGAEAVMRPVLR